MSVRNTAIQLARLIALGIAIIAETLVPSKGWCQVTTSEDTAKRLRTHVTLTLGRTTLNGIATALSAKIGLDIQASDYLKDRVLIIQMTDVSASDVLDSLSELNGLKWEEVKQGHVLLTRRLAKTPGSPIQVGDAIVAALPRDIQRYLGIGVPVDDLPSAENPASARRFETNRAQHPTRRMEAEWRVQPRLKQQCEEAQRALYESLRPRVSDGKELGWTLLAAAQKQMLLRAVTGNALSDLWGNNPALAADTPFNVMTGAIRADLFDVDKDELFLLSGRDLMIGRTTIDSSGRRIFSGSEAPPEALIPKPKAPKP